MTARKLLADARAKGMTISVSGGNLRVKAREGEITPELIAELRKHKPEILKALSGERDTEKLFKREWRRLANRLDSVYLEGALAYVRENEPDLWATLKASQAAFDNHAVLGKVKAGEMLWSDYRRLMLAYFRLNVEGVRRYRNAMFN